MTSNEFGTSVSSSGSGVPLVKTEPEPDRAGVLEHELAVLVVEPDEPEACTVMVMVPSPLSTIVWSWLVEEKTLV